MSVLGKLYISATSSRDKLRSVNNLTSEAIADNIATDVSTRNGITKLQSAVAKAIGEQGHSRAASRSRSLAPSAVDDDHDEVGDDTETQLLDDTIVAAAPNPQSRHTSLGLGESVEGQFMGTTPADHGVPQPLSSFDDTTLQLRLKETESLDSQTALVPSAEGDISQAHGIDDIDSTLTLTDIHSGAQHTASNGAMTVDETVIEPALGPRRRGRPAKAAMESADLVMPALQVPKRNVRASRRKTASLAPSEGVSVYEDE